MRLGTFHETNERECRVAGLGLNVATRADLRLRGGLEVHNGKAAVTDRPELGNSFLELCLA
jgi:hypothetical protein